MSDSLGLDPWAVLGLSEDASYEAAHRAYRLRCQLLHPDRHVGAGSDLVAEAERSMKDLNYAWDQLRDQLAQSEKAWGGTDALDWLLDAFLSTADDCGDAISDHELRYMLRPVRKVQSVRKLERWLDRRTPTLLAAMAKGQLSDWRDCAGRLDTDGIDLIVVMLLDRCLSDETGCANPSN